MQNAAYRPSGASGGEKWYYINGGKRCGPVDAAKLSSMISAGTLPQNTRVWTQGMSNWVPATETSLVEYSGPVLATVVDMPQVVEQPEAKRKSRWWIWLIVGLAAVAIAAVCFFVFFSGDDTPTDPDLQVPTLPVYGLENSVIFENDQCAFIIDAIGEKGDYLELDVRCVNKTADVLSFRWDSTCINGSMFDPLWSVYVQGNSTMKSSITFPLSTLKNHNLLPADQIRFVLNVFNENQHTQLLNESQSYIIYEPYPTDYALENYMQVDGYENHLFRKGIILDQNGLPCYVVDNTVRVYFGKNDLPYCVTAEGGIVYFNEDGQPHCKTDDGIDVYFDEYGRPYYIIHDGVRVNFDNQGRPHCVINNWLTVSWDEKGQPYYMINEELIVHFDTIYNLISGEDKKLIIENTTPDEMPEGYVKVDGYDKYLFMQGVLLDELGQPYYATDAGFNVYFDQSGRPYFTISSWGDVYYGADGRPYYAAEDGIHVFFDKDGRTYFVADDGVNVYFDEIYKWISAETGKYSSTNSTDQVSQKQTWIEGYKKQLSEQGIILSEYGQLHYVNDDGDKESFNDMPYWLLYELQQYVTYTSKPTDKIPSGYMKIDGYEHYLFKKGVAVDESGRPYYMSDAGINVYFDELYDRNGQPLYADDLANFSYRGFYNDVFGRPYYFSDNAETIYYEGYGFAFYDETSGKYYFYDDKGIPTHYGNGGIIEHYDGEVPPALADAEMPHCLIKAGGSHVVHKEFSLYPTGKSADDVATPERITTSVERVYWNGEKGSFIVLGGEMDEFKGYIVHTYIENNSDSYVYLSFYNAVINGITVNSNYITVLRPHSSAYTDVIVPAEWLKANKFKSVEEITCRIHAAGTDLSIPLYPIEWDAVSMTGTKK